jgi:acetyl esterase
VSRPDAETRKILADRAVAGRRPIEEMSVAEARRQSRRDLPVRAKVVGAAVKEAAVPGPAGEVPVRIYRPEAGDADLGSELPLTVFFHGGGFVVCDLDTHDEFCRRLCRTAATVVVSVDYRLAPEAPFPAAVDDAFAVTLWASERARELGAGPARVVVCGDSAGGNLAAVTALRSRDSGGPALAGQLLIYPVTDHYSAAHSSYRQFAEGFGLTRSAMVWFWDHYLEVPEQASHPWVSPLRAPDLSSLPPALVTTAGCDVLVDEGRAYARRLEEAGVPVETVSFDGSIHGFVTGPEVTTAQGKAFELMGSWLAEVEPVGYR